MCDGLCRARAYWTSGNHGPHEYFFLWTSIWPRTWPRKRAYCVSVHVFTFLHNFTCYNLSFRRCFYLAVLPLPLNVSIEVLPLPESVIMDTFDKALQNNLLHSTFNNNRFFAYIAESYIQYPEKVLFRIVNCIIRFDFKTVIGDGNTSGETDPCNVLYLTRYKPLDSALMPELKYTGFLIARVDRDPYLHSSESDTNVVPSLSIHSGHRIVKRDQFQLSSKVRWQRQLTNLDPAYGFSGLIIFIGRFFDL